MSVCFSFKIRQQRKWRELKDKYDSARGLVLFALDRARGKLALALRAGQAAGLGQGLGRGAKGLGQGLTVAGGAALSATLGVAKTAIKSFPILVMLLFVLI